MMKPALITFSLLVVMMCGCVKRDAIVPIDQGAFDPTTTKSQSGTLFVPYLLLDRENWLNYDRGNAVGSIKEAILGTDKEVPLHAGEGLTAFVNNKDLSSSVLKLKPTTDRLPVRDLILRREEGSVRSKVLFDSKFAANLGIPFVGAADGKTSDLFSFNADLTFYKAKYILSITDLVSRRLLVGKGIDLRGLPHLYYTFEELDINSGRRLVANAGSEGPLSILKVGVSASLEYEKSRAASFRNKVFGISFLRSPDYLDDLTYKYTGSPLVYEGFDFNKLSGPESKEFTDWRDSKLEPGVVRMLHQYVINDSSSMRSYHLIQWVKDESAPSQRILTTATVTAKSYLGNKDTIEIDGGMPKPLPSGVGVLLSKYAESDLTPYNSEWFFFVPGRSVEIVTIDGRWRYRKDFVEFIK